MMLHHMNWVWWCIAILLALETFKMVTAERGHLLKMMMHVSEDFLGHCILLASSHSGLSPPAESIFLPFSLPKALLVSLLSLAELQVP